MATTDRVETVQASLLGRDVSYEVSGVWLSYWLLLMRLVVGWWLLHSGLDKFANWPFDAAWFIASSEGTSLGPVVTLFESGIALDFVNIMIPLGQTMIGLGLILGCLTRLASFFGAFLMMFFYFINGETGGWSHGVITGDLLGLLIFAMIATLGAGRVLGIDAYLAKTEFFQNHPRLQYLIG
jgi:thiosulfate dehydrogenase [quinone] large subunit